MKFRIKHLLIATVIVAVFAWAFAIPSNAIVTVLKYAAWSAVLALIVRATTHEAERLVILMGLLGSASYFSLTWWEVRWGDESTLIANLVENVHSKYIPRSNNAGAIVDSNMSYWNTIEIAEMAVATLSGFLAAGLAAYWSRGEHEAS